MPQIVDEIEVLPAPKEVPDRVVVIQHVPTKELATFPNHGRLMLIGFANGDDAMEWLAQNGELDNADVQLSTIACKDITHDLVWVSGSYFHREGMKLRKRR